MTDDRPCIVTPCGGAAPRGAPVRASPLATRCPRPRVAEQAAPPRHHHVHRSLTYFPDGRRTNAGPGDDPPEPPARPRLPPRFRRRPSSRCRRFVLPARGCDPLPTLGSGLDHSPDPDPDPDPDPAIAVSRRAASVPPRPREP